METREWTPCRFPKLFWGDYKYIGVFEDGRGDLYDLKGDFSETNKYLCENMPEMAAHGSG